jgi:hypothetical protein
MRNMEVPDMSIRAGRWIRVAAISLVLVSIPSWSAGQEPAEDGIRITAFGVGTDVVNRELSGEGDTFPEGGQIVFWTKVEGGSGGDVIQHVWIHQGTERLTVDLGIGGSHWRTYSRKTLHRGLTGEWTVEARTTAGEVLASSRFTCETTPAD